MKRIVISLCLGLFFTGIVQAQNVLSGLLLDAETQEPLPYGSIKMIGKQTGTVTNSKGEFQLDVSNPTGVVRFSYMGYTSKEINWAELQKTSTVLLEPATINLSTVEVKARRLTAEEILALVRENLEINHPKRNLKQRVFYHNYEYTPFSKENKLKVKKSNFVGMDKQTLEEMMDLLPEEFIDYQDVLLTCYNDGKELKINPEKGITLEEQSMKDVAKQMETKLGEFFEDIEETNQTTEVYYKFKTGIFGMKVGNKETYDSLYSMQKNDSLHYYVQTKTVKEEFNEFLKNYGDLNSSNWEFLHKPKRYAYTKEEMTVYQNEAVYVISFVPLEKGFYEGKLYVSSKTFALLQIDFAFAEGKKGTRFNLLGIGYVMNGKRGRLIYEKDEEVYALKYISALQHEEISIHRNFTIKKKKKRFLMDKDLNEIKFKTNLTFDLQNHFELLVLHREAISTQQFEEVKEPSVTKFKIQYVYDPQMWKKGTVLVPREELKELE